MDSTVHELVDGVNDSFPDEGSIVKSQSPVGTPDTGEDGGDYGVTWDDWRIRREGEGEESTFNLVDIDGVEEKVPPQSRPDQPFLRAREQEMLYTIGFLLTHGTEVGSKLDRQQ